MTAQQPIEANLIETYLTTSQTLFTNKLGDLQSLKKIYEQFFKIFLSISNALIHSSDLTSKYYKNNIQTFSTVLFMWCVKFKHVLYYEKQKLTRSSLIFTAQRMGQQSDQTVYQLVFVCYTTIFSFKINFSSWCVMLLSSCHFTLMKISWITAIRGMGLELSFKFSWLVTKAGTDNCSMWL